jgi:hypothetical protein
MDGRAGSGPGRQSRRMSCSPSRAEPVRVPRVQDPVGVARQAPAATSSRAGPASGSTPPPDGRRRAAARRARCPSVPSPAPRRPWPPSSRSRRDTDRPGRHVSGSMLRDVRPGWSPQSGAGRPLGPVRGAHGGPDPVLRPVPDRCSRWQTASVVTPLAMLPALP